MLLLLLLLLLFLYAFELFVYSVALSWARTVRLLRIVEHCGVLIRIELV